MGYRSGGMIFPFKGNLEEIVDLINNWTEKDFEILEPNFKANEAIELEFIKDNLVIIHNHNFFFSAYQDKDLWNERLKKSSLNDWVIFFECVDSSNAASYMIFKNNIEVRRVTECEDQAFYQDGEPQDFEKEWVAEVRSWLTPNGEIVFFGDEKQNIYKRTLEEVESEKTNSNLKRPYTGIRGNWHALKKTYRLANHIRKLTNEFQGYFLKENYDYEPLPIDLTFNQTSFNFKSVTYRLDYFYLPEGILTEEKLEKLYQIYRNVAVEYGGSVV